jgi:hypothetical protein
MSVLAAALGVVETRSQAGEITALHWFSGIASIAGDIIGPLTDPNNDNVSGPSPNGVLVTQKAYYGVGPVDIEFTVEPSGGVTEYVINEGVANGTGIDWSAYRLELGFGVELAFVPSPAGDGLDFDAPDFDSATDFSTFFSTVGETEDVVLATGGVFPNGGFSFPLFHFSVDVPDGISAFTIRQIPIAVPEPASAGLAGVALVAAVGMVRRIRVRLPMP